MPNRNLQGDYRYAYQGQEKDTETGKEAFELRLWDSRIGRWLTTDPYGQHPSPYLGMGNNPITRWDPDGGCDQPDADCGFLKRAWFRLTGRGHVVDAWNEFHDPSIQTDANLQYNDWNVNDFEDVVLTGITENGDVFTHNFLNPEIRELERQGIRVLGAPIDVPFGPGGAAKIVNYGPKALKSLRSTELGAQGAEKLTAITQRMKDGDIWLMNEAIYTYVHRGVTYILDGHHRIKAAGNLGRGIEAIELTSKKHALEFFKNNKVILDKILDIHNGLF